MDTRKHPSSSRLLSGKRSERSQDLRHDSLELRDGGTLSHIVIRQELRDQPVDRREIIGCLNDERHEIRWQVSQVILIGVEHSRQRRWRQIAMRGDRTKPAPIPVDGRPQHVAESPESIGQRRLEVDRELDLGNWRNHCFPVLSESIEKNSGNLAASENFRPQLLAADFTASDMREGRPVLGVEERLVVQPVRDGLLTDRGSAEELGEPGRQRGLAAGDLDRSLQSGNVWFIHTHPLYKHACEPVNKLRCSTANKAACKLLYMSERKRKRVNPMEIGADGRTANERLREAFAVSGFSEAELVRECNRIAGRRPDDESYVSQQTINRMRHDLDDAAGSSVLYIIAEALGVRPHWLQLGIEPKREDQLVLLERLKKLLAADSGD
jgi:hypothetical protein